MKKNVIVISGHAFRGKSSTVNKITQLIMSHYPHATSTPSPILYSGDVEAVINIGSKMIGIEAQGDPKSRMFVNLPKYAAMGCDIIICTCRTKGATVDEVLGLKKIHGYEITWATNYRSDTKNQVYLNDLSADQIFILFQDIMAGRI